MSPKVVTEIALQILSGLQHAHENGIDTVGTATELFFDNLFFSYRVANPRYDDLFGHSFSSLAERDAFRENGILL